jgi:glucosamine kinase
LALAGACEPSLHAQAKAVPLPFYKASFTSDAKAACIGAHAGEDGGIVIVGTGTVGWSIVGGREFRIGGWGFPLSDQGSGAWLGSRALMQVLQAYDQLLPWTPLLRSLFAQFASDPFAIVRWMTAAGPREYASLAPLIATHAKRDDPTARNLMRSAGAHIDQLVAKVAATGSGRVALLGGLSASIEPYLSDATRRLLVAARGDAMSGALRMARVHAASLIAKEAGDT